MKKLIRDYTITKCMEAFLDKLSWKLLLIAGPLALTIIVPGIYLIWQGVGK